jgi:hypothetical protein
MIHKGLIVHQLKSNDAVICKDIEEWLEVLKIAKSNKVDCDHFCYDTFFLFYGLTDQRFDTLCSFNCPEQVFRQYVQAKKGVIYSFQDFCAKIKGKYKEDGYYIMNILHSQFGSIGKTSFTPSTPPAGKYKLVRIEDEPKS